MKPRKLNKNFKIKEQWNKKIVRLARQVGIEPTYSNYSINVCLEDRWDTDALFGGQRKDRISKSRGARFTVWCVGGGTILFEAIRVATSIIQTKKYSSTYALSAFGNCSCPACGLKSRMTTSPLNWALTAFVTTAPYHKNHWTLQNDDSQLCIDLVALQELGLTS